MQAAFETAQETQGQPPSDNERLAGSKPKRSAGEDRRCLATGEVLPKDAMVRFALGPADDIVPDLAQDLPGRGLWVKADRGAIASAATKGLFSKAAKKPVKADPHLAELVSLCTVCAR